MRSSVVCDRLTGAWRTACAGTTFPDESFDLSHKGPGVLSMANAGRAHTNGCQFFLTTARAPYLNNKYVAFGNVIDGMDVVNKIDKFGQPNGQPQATVTIRACGQYVLPESISTAFRSTVSCARVLPPRMGPRSHMHDARRVCVVVATESEGCPSLRVNRHAGRVDVTCRAWLAVRASYCVPKRDSATRAAG